MCYKMDAPGHYAKGRKQILTSRIVFYLYEMFRKNKADEWLPRATGRCRD